MAYDNTEALLERLRQMGDEKYRAFNEGLIPGGQPSLGVRVPELRAIAKEILRGDWRTFLEDSREHPLHEMRMLHGMVLGGAKCDMEEKLLLTEIFLPHMGNWAVCDALCASLRPRKGEEGWLFAFSIGCASSRRGLGRRLGLILMMSYFREPPYIDDVMRLYRHFEDPDYYARMGAAWGLATLFPYAREQALEILRDGEWDVFTHNKAIQKMIESRRVSDADKAMLRGLKRKKGDKP